MVRKVLFGKRAFGLALAAFVFLTNAGLSKADEAVPTWPSSSVIYSVYTSIFSPEHSFDGVTAQMDRLKSLGVTVIWIMPITEQGKPINGHPAIGSPYCVHDYFAVNPDYGTPRDFRALVASAHRHGMKVILDEVLNHTSWDNALITQHPDYYVHSDGNPNNPDSIVQAFNYSDVAQLNYKNEDLRKYIFGMLKYWIATYGIDGFRFDCTDDPGGPNRMIPADFWMELGEQMRAFNPSVLLLGENESPALAQKPFTLEYGWWMHDTLQKASTGGSAIYVMNTWNNQAKAFPAPMKLMSMQDDWDYPRDVNSFGGKDGALAAAAFYLTDTGVPLIYNGMEIGNAAGGVNPHDAIDWQSGDPDFTQFYTSMIALRKSNPAFTIGTMTWLPNSADSQVLAYERAGGGKQFLVEVNLSSSAAQGTVRGLSGKGWTEVKIGGVADRAHVSPPNIALPAKGFAIFERALPSSPK